MSDNLIGATTAIFIVSLSIAVTDPVDVAWSTRDGTAKAGTDYQAANGVVSFLPGETQKQIEVIVYGQNVSPTGDKNFFINLMPPTNAVLGTTLIEAVIKVEDESGVPVTSVIVAQGKRGLKGDPGLSAYEQAVLMGYDGTLEDWMQEQADAAAAAQRAGDFAMNALAAAVKAENAATAASFLGNIFPTPEAGVDPVTGVGNGAYYNVRSTEDDSYLVEYQNIGGVPTPSGKSYPSSAALNQVSEDVTRIEQAVIDPVTGKASAEKVIDNRGDTLQKISDSVIRILKDVSQLRTFNGNKAEQQVRTISYSDANPYGGAEYSWDATSTEADNGFSVIAATGVDVGRWKIVVKNNTIDAFSAGITTDVTVSQGAKLQSVIDFMSARGGGKVTLPPATIAANIKGKRNVILEGRVLAGSLYTPATKIIAAPSNGSQVLEVTEPNFKAKYIELDGREHTGTLRASYSLSIGADDFYGFALDSHHSRFDAVYIRGAAKNPVIEHCKFSYVARNVGSLVSCSNVTFNHCQFIEDSTVQVGLYLFDAEPDAPNEVYDVFFNYCDFNKITQTSNSPVILKHTTSPFNAMNVHFNHCKFLGYAHIRINSDNFGGLFLEHTDFAGSVFLGVSTALNTIRYGHALNCHFGSGGIAGSIFAYQTGFTGDFVFENNIFGLNVPTAAADVATWRTNTFKSGITVIPAIDRRTGTRKEMTEIISGAAYSTETIRALDLGTTYVNVLTVPLRSTVSIQIAGADATDSTGSKADIYLSACSDGSTTITYANPRINDTSLGIDYQWSGRTLQLKARTASANQFVVSAKVLTQHVNFRNLTWLV